MSGGWRGWEARLWGSSNVFYIDSLSLPRGTLPTPVIQSKQDLVLVAVFLCTSAS